MLLSRKTIDLDVVLDGCYGVRNFGDKALMVAFAALLGTILPDSQYGIVLFGPLPYVTRLISELRLLLNGASLKGRAMVRIVGGGTHFFSFSNSRPTGQGPERYGNGIGGLLCGRGRIHGVSLHSAAATGERRSG